MKRIAAALTGAAMMLGAGSAGAVVVTHTSFVNGNSSVTMDGFTYQAAAGRHFHTGSTLHHGHSNLNAMLTFSGGAFSLLSLTHSNVTQVTGSNGFVLGNGSSGLSSGLLDFGNNLVGVDWVKIKGHFTIDNVKLDNMPTAIPLPAAALLLISGIGGLGFVGRRRRKMA